jgi:hypothetical protein
LLQPAIYFANNGFEFFFQLVCKNGSILDNSDYGKQLCAQLKAKGTIKQPEVAELLSRVSKNGADEMYTGQWAQNFIATLNDTFVSNITIEDLAQYSTRWNLSPRNTTFSEHTVFTNEEPNYGGAELVEALNILSLSEMNKVNKQNSNYAKNATVLSYMMMIYRWITAMSWYGLRGPEQLSVFQSKFPDVFPTPHTFIGLDQFNLVRSTMQHAQRVWDSIKVNVTDVNRRLDELFDVENPVQNLRSHSDGVVWQVTFFLDNTHLE